MNRRKLSFRVMWGALIALLAAFAFAPGLTADAISLPFMKKAEPETVAVDEQPAADLAIAPEAEEQPRYAPEAADAPAAAIPDQQLPVPDDQGSEGFEGHTTFAMVETSGFSSLNNTPDAHIFRSFGTGGGTGSGSGAAQTASQDHESNGTGESNAQGSPASSPQSSGDDTTSDTSVDEEKTEPLQQEASAGDEKGTEVAFNDSPIPDEKPRVSVPEPSAVMLLLVGIGGLLAMRRMS